MNHPTVGVCESTFEFPEQAQNLARTIGGKVITNREEKNTFEFCLCQTPKGLVLYRNQLKLFVDFRSANWQRRSRTALQREPLAKAIGLGKQPLKILDATAGLARDAFFFASLGCKVDALERSPVLFLLVLDALMRAFMGADKLNLQLTDAKDYLQQKKHHAKYDVIYLDPMYPESSKAALPKKELQILRKLIGQDHDAVELFHLAQKAAPTRIVVKRPRNAPPLADKVQHSFLGKMVRYDLYLAR